MTSNINTKTCPSCGDKHTPRRRVCICGHEFYASKADPNGPIKKRETGLNEPERRLSRWQNILTQDKAALDALDALMKPLIEKRNKLRRRVQIDRLNIRNAKRAMA